jgi:hypothetical protein
MNVNIPIERLAGAWLGGDQSLKGVSEQCGRGLWSAGNTNTR